MAVGPGVPADRVAALRKAFDETMKDPAFLEDAKKRRLSISPRKHQQVLALVKKIVTASPDSWSASRRRSDRPTSVVDLTLRSALRRPHHRSVKSKTTLNS